MVFRAMAVGLPWKQYFQLILRPKPLWARQRSVGHAWGRVLPKNCKKTAFLCKSLLYFCFDLDEYMIPFLSYFYVVTKVICFETSKNYFSYLSHSSSLIISLFHTNKQTNKLFRCQFFSKCFHISLSIFSISLQTLNISANHWKILLECCDAGVSSECPSSGGFLVADADLANSTGLLGANGEGCARIVELRLTTFWMGNIWRMSLKLLPF